LPQPLVEFERLKYAVSTYTYIPINLSEITKMGFSRVQIPSCREMPDWLPEVVFGHTSYVQSSLITHDVEAHEQSDRMVEDIVYYLLHVDIAAREIFADGEDDDSTVSDLWLNYFMSNGKQYI